MTNHLTDLQVAAVKMQSAPIDEMFALLEHAASCPQCHERVVSRRQMALELAGVEQSLRGVMSHLSLDELNGFVDRALPESEMNRLHTHVAACSTCSSNVAELQAWVDQSSSRTLRQSLSAWITRLFTMPRMAMATALVLTLVAALGSWQVLRHRQALPQTAKTGTPRPLPGPSGPSSSPAGLPPAIGPSAAPGPDRARPTLAVVLLPGLMRGATIEKSITVTTKTGIVQLSLRSRSELTAGRYVVSLSEDGRHNVLQQTLSYTTRQQAIVLRVPFDALQTGRYLITLSVIDAKGAPEDLEDYAFRIVKKDGQQ